MVKSKKIKLMTLTQKLMKLLSLKEPPTSLHHFQDSCRDKAVAEL